MSDDNMLSPGGEDVSTSTSELAAPVSTTNDAPLSPREAYNKLTDRRRKDNAASSNEHLQAQEKTPINETPDPSIKTAPGDETAPDATDPAEKPPIEPPRSWTKEAKARFEALDRDTQEYVAQREAERDREVRRVQNEAAELRKSQEGRTQEVEQLRRQFEQALPGRISRIQQDLAEHFSDVGSWEDANRLAQADPARYVSWKALVDEGQALSQEAVKVQQEEHRSRLETFQRFAEEQNQLAQERIPDLADPVKRVAAEKQALDTLKAVGFSEDELAASYNGGKDFSLRDARWQEIVWKASRFDAAEKAAKAVSKQAKPAPAPAQRPGVVQSRGERNADATRSLETRLERTGNMRDAYALLKARRSS
jgi:hypothetical protein